MSHSINTELLEKAAQTIDLANDHIEYFNGTTMGKVLHNMLARVEEDIADNNLEDLAGFSLPALNLALVDSAHEMALHAQEEFMNTEAY